MTARCRSHLDSLLLWAHPDPDTHQMLHMQSLPSHPLGGFYAYSTLLSSCALRQYCRVFASNDWSSIVIGRFGVVSSTSASYAYICVSITRLTEIRAAQRTFEGAYMRTALSQFSFALIILKIFTSEFYAIGALFAAYGAAILLVAIFRRYEGNSQFFDQEESDSETDDDDDGLGHDPLDGDAAAMRGRRRVQMIRKKFRTSGNSVTLLTALSLVAYITLLTLALRL